MKYYTVIKSILVLILITELLSCSKKSSDAIPQSQVLAIKSLSVTLGPANTKVVITGTGFDANQANDKVFFNGKAGTVTEATTTQLTTTVPLGAGTGNVTVSVDNSSLVSGPVFTYQLSAFVTTYAGSGLIGATDGNSANASFYNVWGMVTDATGNLYVADYGISLLRKITPDGNVTTVAGGYTQSSVDGIGKTVGFTALTGLTIDGSGNLYISDNNLLRKMTPGGTVTTLTAKLASAFYASIAIDAAGNLYAADKINGRIEKLSPQGVLTTFAGSGIIKSEDGKGTSASFANPVGLTIDASGNLFVTEMSCCVRKITPDGQVTTIAGQKGSAGYGDGKGTAALFNSPTGIVVDAADNLYVCDQGNNLIRKITSDGTVSTLAGSRFPGSADGQGAVASFNQPVGITINVNGDLYIGDGLLVRKITMQ